MTGKEEKTLDLINRDPRDLNNYIQVQFEDVLGEPEGAHSADCIWKFSYTLFDFGKNLGYTIFTFCCGLCVALGWGCLFAGTAFSSIWFWTPLLRLITIVLHPTKKIISIVLSTFVGPYMETMGLIFARIHVTNSEGEPPKPLGELGGDDMGSKVKNFK